MSAGKMLQPRNFVHTHRL